MDEFARDRNLDDFLNELKSGTPRVANKTPRDYVDPLKPYNSIHLQPDLVNTIESLKILVDRHTERLLSLETKHHSFTQHLADLNKRISGLSVDGSPEIIQKVENFMTYYVSKVEEKIKVAEKKMEMERSQMILETEKRMAQAPPPPSPIPSSPPTPAEPSPSVHPYGHPESIHTARSGDVLHETARKVEVLNDRMKLTDDLLVRYMDKQNKQYKKLKKDSVPKWLYWLNIFLLTGIFLYLLQHFFSHYKIVVKPEEHSGKRESTASPYAVQSTPSVPLLPDQKGDDPIKKVRSIRRKSFIEKKSITPSWVSLDKTEKLKPPKKMKETTVYLATDE